MKRRTFYAAAAMAAAAFAKSISLYAQAPAADAAANSAQQAQAQAAGQGKYAFIVFYREDNDAARAMAQAVAALTAERSNSAVAIYVQITNPADQAIVKQYDVARAPMPLTLVTAPNGAITGMFPQRVTAEQLAGSFVTPAMSHCMRSMQQGRLVFLCSQTTSQRLVPQGVADFLTDPHFKDRTDVVYVQVADPAEAELLAELAFQGQTDQPNTAFFAPPGALVGKFGPASRKEEIAAALHKAGKCCDDPNCKHGQAAKSATGTVR